MTSRKPWTKSRRSAPGRKWLQSWSPSWRPGSFPPRSPRRPCCSSAMAFSVGLWRPTVSKRRCRLMDFMMLKTFGKQITLIQKRIQNHQEPKVLLQKVGWCDDVQFHPRMWSPCTTMPRNSTACRMTWWRLSKKPRSQRVPCPISDGCSTEPRWQVSTRRALAEKKLRVSDVVSGRCAQKYVQMSIVCLFHFEPILEFCTCFQPFLPYPSYFLFWMAPFLFPTLRQEANLKFLAALKPYLAADARVDILACELVAGETGMKAEIQHLPPVL